VGNKRLSSPCTKKEIFMIPKKFNVAIWLGLLSAFLWSGLAEAQTAAVNQKIELTVLAELQRRGEVTFFVVLKEQADVSRATAITDWSPRGQAVVDSLKQVADRTQRPILNFLANRNAEITPFWIVNTIKVRTSDELLIHQLAALPDVASISADETWQIPEPLPGVEELTIQGIEWGVVRVRAPEVWTQFNVRGEGIVVSNIDTGVQYDHPAVKTQYRGLQEDGTFDHNYNWHDPSQICGNPSLVPCDNTSHGTHTMGTAVGDDGGTNQIGVASRAKWIAAKGCETDSCSQSALLSSGQWVLPQPTSTVKIRGPICVPTSSIIPGEAAEAISSIKPRFRRGAMPASFPYSVSATLAPHATLQPVQEIIRSRSALVP
jgi:hypothetical protein